MRQERCSPRAAGREMGSICQGERGRGSSVFTGDANPVVVDLPAAPKERGNGAAKRDKNKNGALHLRQQVASVL